MLEDEIELTMYNEGINYLEANFLSTMKYLILVNQIINVSII